MSAPFLQFLISQNAVGAKDAERLSAEYERGERSLESVLLESGSMDDDAILRYKGDFYHVPAVTLENKLIDRNVLGLFPKEVVTNYRIAPFEYEDGSVRVAMVDPENLKAREAVDFLARQKGWNTQFYVTTEKGLKHVLDQYSGTLTSEVGEALEYADRAEAQAGEKREKKQSEEDLEEVVKSAPVSKMVSVILRHAVEGGASDIHIEPQENESRVRYRIDGDLHATLALPKYIHNSIVSRIKVLANLKLDETRKPQDGRIHLEVSGRQIDFRISTLPLAGAEKVVMRILDVTRGAPTLDELGFIGRNLAVMKRQITKPNGMFLVTGPTGSGKSTTLFSALSVLNQEKVNIITLEDPIEYYLPGANQSQVRPEVGYTFASGLRSILRQDPDIIMVGEIRDNETASLAVQAALTGHIVLSTLHTNDALGSIPRLIDMKVEPFLLATTLNIVQAQRLVRKICQHCKEETELPPDLAQKAQSVLVSVPDAALYAGVDRAKPTYYKGRGCSKCGETGYQGRLSISEVIENTKAMQDIISKGFDRASAERELQSQGFISMMQDGIMKSLLGLTTADEVVVATKE
ncbi:MAG: type II/IV secretion system protein [Parcubacteria group bacterium]|nr:type II/IV secretion system protein [Parcubacteria group bacterium]